MRVKKPFGLAGETVVFGVVAVPTVLGELEPAEPHAVKSIATTPIAARDANLPCEAISAKAGSLPTRTQAALPVSLQGAQLPGPAENRSFIERAVHATMQSDR